MAKNISIYLFPNYFEMARKRLSSCKHLLKLCSTSDTPLYTLHDIYYLSGYILEGFIIYSIYKLYGWDELTPINDGRQGDNMTQKDIRDFFNKTNLGYYFNEGKYHISGHNFQHYVELLRNRPEFNSLPFFTSRKLRPEIEYLVDNWKPELRYSYGTVSLSIENLNSLLDFCDDVKTSIMNEVG